MTGCNTYANCLVLKRKPGKTRSIQKFLSTSWRLPTTRDQTHIGNRLTGVILEIFQVLSSNAETAAARFCMDFPRNCPIVQVPQEFIWACCVSSLCLSLSLRLLSVITSSSLFYFVMSSLRKNALVPNLCFLCIHHFCSLLHSWHLGQCWGHRTWTHLTLTYSHCSNDAS